ncbi:MAG TPA: Holliday junction resolvase RuvX [Pirellulaceae bacterium]|nr:Holliday junction resolvase RuvX [Pirellulaceae bacterium]
MPDAPGSSGSTDATQNTLPASGRIAGIDYGTVRIGIAVTDPERRLASPHSIYNRRSRDADARFFRQLATEERLAGFVVGLPVHTHGGESQKSRESRAFGDWLTECTGLPVVYFDERYTTVAADELLGAAELTRKQRKERRDKLAAQILLVAFLEAGQRATTEAQRLDD